MGGANLVPVAVGVAEDQPAKFAAFECVEETGPNQTEYIGGICTDEGVKYGIGIPGLNSWLVGFSTDTVVTGLDQIPDDEEPPSNTLLHLAFGAMVGIGFGLLALGSWFGFVWWRRRDLPETKWFLRGVAVSGIGAVVALESGWIVTEVGRQPWIVWEQMRVSEAVTTAGGLWWWFAGAVALYAALGTAAVIALRILVRRDAEGDAPEVPYGPPSDPPLDDRRPTGTSS